MESLFDHSFSSFLSDNQIPEKSRLVIGFSGGPDSTALLYLLHSFVQNHKNLFRLTAASLNHNLRDASIMKKEERIIRSHCQLLEIPLDYKSLVPGECEEFCRKENLSPEEGARILRHRFFNTLIKENENDFLVLAHTKDDQVETVLLRFLQGSGIRGLSGIASRNGNIIRPLLNLSKSELVEYLDKKKIRYCHDKSNDENRYFRNKTRNQLLPLVREFLPGIDNTLVKQGLYFNEISNCLYKSREDQFRWERKGPFFICDAASFFAAERLHQLDSLQQKINCLRKGELKGTIPHRFFDILDNPDILKSKRKLILDSYDIFLLKNDDKLILGRNDIREEHLFRKLSIDSEFRLWNYRFSLSSSKISEQKKIISQVINERPDQWVIRPLRDQDKMLKYGRQKKISSIIPSSGKWIKPHVMINDRGIIKVLIYFEDIFPCLLTADSKQLEENGRQNSFFSLYL